MTISKGSSAPVSFPASVSELFMSESVRQHHVPHIIVRNPSNPIVVGSARLRTVMTAAATNLATRTTTPLESYVTAFSENVMSDYSQTVVHMHDLADALLVVGAIRAADTSMEIYFTDHNMTEGLRMTAGNRLEPVNHWDAALAHTNLSRAIHYASLTRDTTPPTSSMQPAQGTAHDDRDELDIILDEM
jgi:hypothetical protein